MIVNIIKDAQMFSMTLPSKVKGQYWINDIADNGKARQLISVEAIDGEWVVKSNSTAWVLDVNNKQIDNTLLRPLSFFNLNIKNSNEKALLFSEPLNTSRQSYKKYVATEACELSIGRTTDNNICFDNKFVSSHHAKLIYSGNAWSISDCASTNGTFVNTMRTTSQPLFAGDVVYIMGLKIVLGDQYFAINNPDENLIIKSASIVNFTKQEREARKDEDSNDIEEVYFYRSPRFKREAIKAEIKIDAPPALQKLDTVPLALMLGPSLTMGLTSLSTGLLTLSNVMNNGGNITTALPTLFMSFSMLLGTVLWPILTKKHEKKAKVKNEQKRQSKYLAYLNTVRDEIKRVRVEQAEILSNNVITLEECSNRVLNVKRNLWERTIGQNDFLRLRVGVGDLPMDIDLKFPEKRFALDDDNLQDALYSLSNEPTQLTNVPISISLIEKFNTGIIGNREKAISLAKSLILQTIALHSYDELKIVVIADKDEDKDWEFVKYLPHIWNNEKTQRFFAADVDEIKDISILLEKNIAYRLLDEGRENVEYNPHYLIICANKELADKCEVLTQMIKASISKGFSIVTLYNEINNLPKETNSVIDLGDVDSKIFDKDDISGKCIFFKQDFLNGISIKNVAECIANIQLDLASQRFALPSMLTFLEMFNVGKIEHLNSLTRWKENNPSTSLQTPVGVNTAGEAFMLDLHEKFHGPHGLVAGMTGSGKSEFVISYILSLAINYHPNEVAFILIDYKGGGLTGAFENTDTGVKLPHLAGTITNLDGAAVKRSLISIQSELRRRQFIFNEARKKSNEGTMDIYKYQHLYRNGVVIEPVPHLFIISDEFAELKTQQPEFMEQLISAARIGRSLGIHLILATQKPSGVVDDQIWSNSKFRVCLKVQEKADSIDMIKCPDAAELSQTGRFYLQVGFNELFAQGQSAWCGASYHPAETLDKKTYNAIQVINNLGSVVKEIKIAQKTDSTLPKLKQIVSVVKYLHDLSIEEKIVVRPLWLNPIPSKIYIDDIEQKYQIVPIANTLNPVIGEYDDPFNQRQSVLTLPLSKEGNCVMFGSAGNGKTTFLASLAYSLVKNYSVRMLNLYIMDFASETLRAFDKAPQVGGVLFIKDNEKIINLFKMLKKELEMRKELFAEFGGDYASYCKSNNKEIPNIVVMLNNYAAFYEAYEDLAEVFEYLTGSGLKYGIYFVVTANHANAIRYRTLQNFKQLFTMQLNDASDYATIVGKTDGLIPTRFKGRGLASLERVYEFQVAHCADVDDQYEFIRSYCVELKNNDQQYAKRIPVLPKLVNRDVFDNTSFSINSIPVGIDRKALVPVYLNVASKYMHQVSYTDTYQSSLFMQGFAEILAAGKIDTYVIDAEMCFAQDIMQQYKYFSSNFEKEIIELFNDILERNNVYKDAKMNVNVLEKYACKVYLIVGVKKLFEMLSDDGKDKLKVLFEKGEAIFKIHFIIADTLANYNMLSYEQWFKSKFSGSDGVWIGDGFADQYLIRSSKITTELYKEIGDEFGYAVTRGKPTQIKLITSKSTIKEDDFNG